jgi:hypothetical protein
MIPKMANHARCVDGDKRKKSVISTISLICTGKRRVKRLEVISNKLIVENEVCVGRVCRTDVALRLLT